MAWFSSSLGYIVPFLVVLTALVFVHELGHYLCARRNGVRVQVFSIGFGPEIFGWNDRAGTRWKLSWIPLGGYIKMFGDADAASAPSETLEAMSESERAVSFHHKRLMQRVEIVAAGPIANFLFAIVLLAAFFVAVGERFTPPEVEKVLPESAAERAGIEPGDRFVIVDGKSVERFEDVQQTVSLNAGTPIQVVVRRGNADITLMVTPTVETVTDNFGNNHHFGRLGIYGKGPEYVRRDPFTAVVRAFKETWNLSAGTLTALGQMIIGSRTTEELGGPIRIAQMSGEIAQGGLSHLITFMAVLSVNLGLINLFPIPVLDGGHLLFYLAEAIRGKPLGQRAQEYGFRVGLALVLTLMVFATWNDLVNLRVIAFLKGLVT